MATATDDAAVIKQLFDTARKFKEQAMVAGRAQQHDLSSAFADKARRLEEQAQALLALTAY